MTNLLDKKTETMTEPPRTSVVVTETLSQCKIHSKLKPISDVQDLIDVKVGAPPGDAAADADFVYKSIGKKYKRALGNVKCIMIDVSGTLYDEESLVATPGAAEAITRLRNENFHLQFVINSLKGMPKDLSECLKQLGFDVKPKEIFTSIKATVMHLKKNEFRPLLLVDKSVMPYFKRVKTLNPNVVVIGLYATQLNYNLIHKALKMLSCGAPLLSFNQSYVEYVGKGEQRLGPGPFIQSLEYLTQAEQTILSKPSKLFFEYALETSGFKPEECVLIGDDICEDIGGAHQSGVKGILVQTGDYKICDETHLPVSALAKDFYEAVTIILCATYAARGEVYRILKDTTDPGANAGTSDEGEVIPELSYEFLNEVCGYTVEKTPHCKLRDSQIW